MAKIAIDAGHGRYTPGKRCLKTLDPNETREWVLNARVADELEVILKSAGHEVLRVDDITGNTDVSLAKRVRLANEWGADYYMSIHQNAGIKGGAGGGTIVFVYPGSTGITLTTQEAIYAHVIARGGLKGNRSDGTGESDLFVLRETNMPASLIECGFMDSSTDIRYILNPEWSKKVALGIAEGICEVWGGTVNKAGWKQDNKGWYYVENGNKVTNRWVMDSATWCYVGSDGYCVKNTWQKDSQGWCYLGADGRLVTNAWAKDSQGWYYLGADGHPITGWKQDNNKWYYLNSDGLMQTGLHTIDGAVYYFAADGHMCRTNNRGALV